MKKIIALVLCFLLSAGPAFATPQPSSTGSSGSSSAGTTGSASGSTSLSTTSDCSKVKFPMGVGGGRSPDCLCATDEMKKNNKMAEEAAAGIAKAAEEQANNESDSIMDQLMNCISTLNINILGGLDLSGLSWEAILAALKNAVCRFAKEKTREIWQEGLAQMTFEVGGRAFNIQNVDLLGINVINANVGGPGKVPVLISRTPTQNDIAYRMFKGSSSINAGLAGTGMPSSGNSFLDDFISMSLEEVLESTHSGTK